MYTLAIYIVYMCVDPSSWSCLRKHIACNRNTGVLEDIYDGVEYRKHQSFLNCPGNVSLTFNTDGVSICRSSKVSVWPV